MEQTVRCFMIAVVKRTEVYSMAKQMKQDTPLVPRKRRLAALIAATRCGGENRDTLSCYARRCTASSMAQGLKHYA